MHYGSGFHSLESGLLCEFASWNSDWDGTVEICQHFCPATLGHKITIRLQHLTGKYLSHTGKALSQFICATFPDVAYLSASTMADYSNNWEANKTQLLGTSTQSMSTNTADSRWGFESTVWVQNCNYSNSSKWGKKCHFYFGIPVQISKHTLIPNRNKIRTFSNILVKFFFF